MISLEQVKLLESKVTRTIDYVKKVTDENKHLKGKLDSYQKRIDELEVLIQRFKEDQSRIEDGILSALDRLNQFEDALENTLSRENTLSKESVPQNKKDISARETVTAQPEKPISKPAAETADSDGEELKSAEELDIF